MRLFIGLLEDGLVAGAGNASKDRGFATLAQPDCLRCGRQSAAGRVASACWVDWAQGFDTGGIFGIVDTAKRHRG